MQGLKAPANSCRTSPTRRLSVELDQGQLARAFRLLLTNVVGAKPHIANKLWEQFWVLIKGCPSFTTRVNGRVLVRHQFVVSKTTRRKIEALNKRRQELWGK